MRPFLTAEWKNLILLTYAVDPDVLDPYLPKGLSLDLYKDKAFVSFVAFEFLNTKVKGVPIPFHINFPEVNLRFYVKHIAANGEERRGVVFIKELVPKFMIALVANKIYNEPYQAVPMKGGSSIENEQITMRYKMKIGNENFSWKFIAKDSPYYPNQNSTEHFFKEHEWGFGTNHKGQLMRYKVEHPVWKIYPLEERFELKVDFGTIYGEDWSFLNSQIPYNIMVAKGSPIKVFPGEII